MGGGGGTASFRARWRFDRRRLSLKRTRLLHATLLRRTAESPLSRGERGVQGLSQVGEQVVDHSLKV